MFRIILTLMVLASSTCYASDSGFTFEISGGDNRYTVMLTSDSVSKSGSGSTRARELAVSVEAGMFDKEPVTQKEKIAALESKLFLYKLLEKYNIDSEQKVNAIYKEKPLKNALSELLPKVPVVFKGIDKNVKLKEFVASDTSMEKVLEYLDDGAGVYFEYKEDKLIIKSAP